MTVNSETASTSAQFAQIFKSVKQLKIREQLTLAGLLLESILNAKSEVQDEGPTGFLKRRPGLGQGNH